MTDQQEVLRKGLEESLGKLRHDLNNLRTVVSSLDDQVQELERRMKTGFPAPATSTDRQA
jgi:hypothetical protein